MMIKLRPEHRLAASLHCTYILSGIQVINLSFAEFVVTGHKSNRTSKTYNQNPFKHILMTHKIRPNGI